jgi:hypothetical protein
METVTYLNSILLESKDQLIFILVANIIIFPVVLDK